MKQLFNVRPVLPQIISTEAVKIALGLSSESTLEHGQVSTSAETMAIWIHRSDKYITIDVGIYADSKLYAGINLQGIMTEGQIKFDHVSYLSQNVTNIKNSASFTLEKLKKAREGDVDLTQEGKLLTLQLC